MMEQLKTCAECDALVKEYLDDTKIPFKAKCQRYTVQHPNKDVQPRVIMEKCGPMIGIECPEWCPRKRNVTQTHIVIPNTNEKKTTTLILPPPTNTPTKVLTYAEKMNALKELRKAVEWDDIEVGNIYIIPKTTSYKKGKRVKVVSKNDTSFSYRELDLESGEPSSTISYCYRTDVDTTLLTQSKNF